MRRGKWVGLVAAVVGIATVAVSCSSGGGASASSVTPAASTASTQPGSTTQTIPTRSGSTQPGSTQLGSTQLGSTQLGSTQPGSTTPARRPAGTAVPGMSSQPPASTPPARTYSGQLPLHYDLADPSSAPTDIAVEFTTDNGTTWFYCTPGAGGDGTKQLSTSPTGVAHTFVWDTAADLGATLQPAVVVAICPTGQPASISAPFAIDDRTPSAPPTSSGIRDWTRAPAIVEVTGAASVLAVGDVHGDYQTLAALLATAKVIAGIPTIPASVQWNAGAAVLVCTGDLIDKYTDSLDVIALFRALQPQAAAAGGQVIVLMGNHEAEFLAGGGTNGKAVDFENELTAAGLALADVANGTDARGIGAWLRALPMAARIDDWFFCHAGNTGGQTLDQLRGSIQSDVDANGFSANVLVSADSMLEARMHPTPWWEGLSTAGAGQTQAAADRATLASYVAALGAKHLVIGHQPVAIAFSDGSSRAQDQIFANFGGLFFVIDCGMSRGVDSAVGAVLDIEGTTTARPTATALFADGTTRVLLK